MLFGQAHIHITIYRFGVKYEHDPSLLWRDIAVNVDRLENQVPV